MKSIKNLISVCFMVYNFHKDGADITINWKERTINFLGDGYNDTIEF